MREAFCFMALIAAYCVLIDPAGSGDVIATFVSHAQGIEAGTAETERLSPKGESPAR